MLMNEKIDPSCKNVSIYFRLGLVSQNFLQFHLLALQNREKTQFFRIVSYETLEYTQLLVIVVFDSCEKKIKFVNKLGMKIWRVFFSFDFSHIESFCRILSLFLSRPLWRHKSFFSVQLRTTYQGKLHVQIFGSFPALYCFSRFLSLPPCVCNRFSFGVDEFDFVWWKFQISIQINL